MLGRLLLCDEPRKEVGEAVLTDRLLKKEQEIMLESLGKGHL